jgi:hypothetical protein
LVEKQPPQSATAVHWLLLTSVPMTSLKQALRCVRWYCRRWRIEEWHRVMKSGCRILDHQNHTAEVLLRAISQDAVIAWRIMLLADEVGLATRRMVFAKVAGRDFAVAYLPDNDGIEVDLSAFSKPVAARWFDPARGQNLPAPGRIQNQGVHRFAPPGEGDWVLVVEPAEGIR